MEEEKNYLALYVFYEYPDWGCCDRCCKGIFENTPRNKRIVERWAKIRYIYKDDYTIDKVKYEDKNEKKLNINELEEEVIQECKNKVLKELKEIRKKKKLEKNKMWTYPHYFRITIS